MMSFETNHRLPRWVFCIAAAALLTIFSTTATAQQPAEPDAQRESASGEAADGEQRTLDDLTADEKDNLNFLVESAKDAYREKHYQKAIPFLERAYEILPDPAFHYRIASSYEKAGNPAKAVEFYRRYLQAKPDSPKRGEVEATIASLEEQIQAGRQTEEAEETDRADSPAPTPPPSGLSGNQKAGIILTSTGGALTIGTVGFGLAFLGADSTYDAMLSDRRQEQRSDVIAQQKQRNGLLVATYVTGTLAVGSLGVGIFMLGKGDTPTSASTAPSAGPRWRVSFGPGSVGLSTKFR